MAMTTPLRFDSNAAALEHVRKVGIDVAQLDLDEDLKLRELRMGSKFLFERYEDRAMLLHAIGELLGEQRRERAAAEELAFQEAIKQRIANEQAAKAATESVDLAGRSLDLARRDLETAVASLHVAESAYNNARESNKIASDALTTASRSATAAEEGVRIARDALIAADRSATAAEKSASTADRQSCIAVWAAVAAAASALISLFGLFAEKPPITVPPAPAQLEQSPSNTPK